MLLEPCSVIEIVQKQNSGDPSGAFPYVGELKSGAAALSGSTRQFNTASSGRLQLTPIWLTGQIVQGRSLRRRTFHSIALADTRPNQNSISPTYGWAEKMLLLVRKMLNRLILKPLDFLEAVIWLFNIVCRLAYQRRSIEHQKEGR